MVNECMAIKFLMLINFGDDMGLGWGGGPRIKGSVEGWRGMMVVQLRDGVAFEFMIEDGIVPFLNRIVAFE